MRNIDVALGGSTGSAIATLTCRELELLRLMACGRSNHAISDELCLSPKTVETHVRSVFWKLGLLPDAMSHRRVAAVLLYLQATDGTLTSDEYELFAA